MPRSKKTKKTQKIVGMNYKDSPCVQHKPPSQTSNNNNLNLDNILKSFHKTRKSHKQHIIDKPIFSLRDLQKIFGGKKMLII
uniref:Uncharacterized protein n=1 Tax=viral metagenome TaxID=1070528 RepID=A0A6C0FAT6_9ZZZZ|tara:strand:- start:1101 stop:1346 length:246 start_codon:yes stop_codon:yes gene_type:complete